MSLLLYAHPFSSYCQKALIALWADSTEFTYRARAADEGRPYRAYFPPGAPDRD